MESGLWIPSRKPIAKGAVIGAFLGFSPLLGAHIPISILLCYVFRANVAVAILATYVSNPFTILGLAWMQVKLGQWMMPDLLLKLSLHSGLAGYFTEYARPFLLGSLVFSVVGGSLAYPLALWIWDKSERSAKRRKAGIRDAPI